MCNKLATLAAAALSLTAFAELDIDKQKELAAMNDRPVLLSREMITDPAGYKFIVEHWKNPGEHQREWVTNKAWKVTGSVQTTTWSREIEKLNAEVEKWLNQSNTYSNMIVIVRGQLQAAKAKITDEIADLNAKIAKYEEYKTKYPILKSVWNALITDAQNRIRILEALAEGN